MVVMALPSTISGYASETALFVNKQRQNSYELLQESNALGLAAKGTFQKLEEVYKECSMLGWEGENAVPISREVILYTQIFLRSLPFGIEAPEIGAEPDGAITLEWYRSIRKVLSVSINPDGWVYYAALNKAKVPVEMHLYAKGGHAFGLRRTDAPVTEWPLLVEKWLGTMGVISQSSSHLTGKVHGNSGNKSGNFLR